MKKVTKFEVPRAQEQKLRVAAYARVSTDSDEQRISLETQKEYYEKLIRSNPRWEFAGLYYDEGITGVKKDVRDGLMQLLKDCRKHKVDFVIVKSISRLARNTVDTLEIVRELTQLGIFLLFEKENINTLDASGEVMLTIMAAMAQQESESLSKNVRLGIKFRNEQGKVQVNHNWFLGYTKDSEGKLIVDEEQAAIVRRIYSNFLAGMGYNQIKRDLENNSIKNGAGHTKWHVSNIKQILTNEKYIGDALLQKTYTYNVLEKKRRKNKTDAPQYYVSGDHEAIISKETYAAVQVEMARRSNVLGEGERKRIYSGRFAFSGILFCGNCGDVVSRFVWDIHGKKKPVWRCVTRAEYGMETCDCRKLDEDTLHDMVRRAINMAKAAHEVNTELFAECMSETLNENLNEQISTIEAQIQKLQESLLFLKAGSDEIDALGSKIIHLRDEKNELLAEAALEKQRVKETKECLRVFEGIQGELETLDSQYVRSLVSKIIVYEDRVEFFFKDGQELSLYE